MAKIFSLAGNRQKLDGGAMFGNAPKNLWEKWLTPDSQNRITLACRSLMICDGGLKLLCEAGIGAFFEPKLALRYGVEESEHLLLKEISQRGWREEDIDYVLLSHLHFDHVGGLLPSYRDRQIHGDRLLFPKAKYVVSQTAWERAIKPHPRDQASFVPEIIKLLKESGRLIIVSGDFLPGVLEDRLSFFQTHGHTPGHMHVKYRGPKHTVVFAGDLIPGVPWIHLPLTMGYDRFAELVIDEKLKFLEDAIKDGWYVFYTHDPVYGLSAIVRDEKGKYGAHMSKCWKEQDITDLEI